MDYRGAAAPKNSKLDASVLKTVSPAGETLIVFFPSHFQFFSFPGLKGYLLQGQEEGRSEG